MLEGSLSWSPTTHIRLVQDFGIDTSVAKHLSHTYGDFAINVAKLSTVTGKRWPVVGKRIHPEFPYLEAEVSSWLIRLSCKKIRKKPR